MQKTKSAKTAMIVGMLAALSVALYLGGATVNQGAFAAKEAKGAHYVSESGSTTVIQSCLKDPSDPTDISCKDLEERSGENVNQRAREQCEEQSGEKCKREKLP